MPRSMLARLALTLILLVALAAPLVLPLASAAADVRPEEMTSRRAGDLVFHYPERFAPAVDALEASGPAELARLESELGLGEMADIDVWVLPEVDDFYELRGEPNRAPEWAIGLSLSDRSTIILVGGAHRGEAVDLHKTFVHELAHVAMDRARGGYSVPRWFNEGFAIMHAEEWTPQRSDMLARSAAAGALSPLMELAHNFPGHHNSASLAYAQSFFVVRQMSHEFGDDIYARVLARVRDGQPFPQAFRAETNLSLAQVEAKWLQALKNNASGLSMLMDGMLVFFGASILFVVAYAVRRHRSAKKLASMDPDTPDDGWDYDTSRYPLPGDHKP